MLQLAFFVGLQYLIILNTADICGHGRPAQLNESTGIIISPGYEKHIYPNNVMCTWLIMASSGKVSMSDCQYKWITNQ